jgi:glycosyltransferase involved in cell wall biosynthesis
MKKILYIHHGAGWGGAPYSLIKLINNLDNSKYEAEVLLLKQSVLGAKLAENRISYRIADSVFYRKYYRFFAHSEAGYIKWYQVYTFFACGISWILSRYYFAAKELARHETDIIHLNSSVLTDWLAPAKKRGHAVIHIREPFRHGKIDPLHYIFRNLISKYADRIIAISKDNARRIDIPDKTEVIYNFTEIPSRGPEESSYSSRKALYLGGSGTSKGFYTLVDSLDFLDKDIKVYFGGKYVVGPRSAGILRIINLIFSKEKKRKAAISKINNHPNATLIGLIYDVNDLLDEVCCVVSPFLVPHFSRPVIEAHMHKKPVIGSDVVGMDEIIDHEINGLIVERNNPAALATALNSLTADSSKVIRLGEAGYSQAVRIFSPMNIDKIESLYDQLS